MKTMPLSLPKICNRLWFRLTMAFACVALVTSVVNAIVGILVSLANLPDEVINYPAFYQQSGGLIDELRLSYSQTKNWQEAIGIMRGFQSSSPPIPQLGLTLSHRLTASDGTIIYNSHPEFIPPDADILEYTFLIQDLERDDIVGQLHVMRIDLTGNYPVTSTATEAFTHWLRESWWRIIIVGLVIGIFFGFLISRNFANRLGHLAETANQLSPNDLDKHVIVRGSIEEQQLAIAFNAMLARLKESEQLRRNLVADVAHELRTPLTVLQGNLRAILDDVYPMNKSEVAGLYDQTRLLARLVNDLHELSQAEARKLPFQKESINLSQLIRRLADTFDLIAEAEGVRMEVNIPNDVRVYGDAGRLLQVMHNLLTNALQHTPAGGQITLTIQVNGEQLTLFIKDTGNGIPAHHLPYVFDRFYRVDRSRSRKDGGTGLGLAISKAIVEAHHGRIWAMSDGEAGKGATFIIELPLSHAY